jgi:hypothetical protein
MVRGCIILSATRASNRRGESTLPIPLILVDPRLHFINTWNGAGRLLEIDHHSDRRSAGLGVHACELGSDQVEDRRNRAALADAHLVAAVATVWAEVDSPDATAGIRLQHNDSGQGNAGQAHAMAVGTELRHLMQCARSRTLKARSI